MLKDLEAPDFGSWDVPVLESLVHPARGDAC
jgi:hypothetical protein